jgi:hypothetical protein
MPKVITALAIQLGVLGFLAAIVTVLPYFLAPPYPMWMLVFVQASLAALLSSLFGLPSWWRWIQFFIPWGLFAAIEMDLNPWIGLIGFMALWLVFYNASKERVPLYLTNNTTRQAFKALLEQMESQNKVKDFSIKFMDLGCGLGGNVVFMASQPEVKDSVGVETAPIPYLLARLFTKLRGGRVLAQDLWKTPLKDSNLVYAFLSTEPMPKLWQKVQSEMQPGSVFVSNSFPVPEVEPTEIWELSDKRQTRLFIYVL